jgi:hypothetical protein
MFAEKFRPWGLLPWVLSKLAPRTWSVIGCFNTEHRCLAAWSTFVGRSRVGRSLFIEVADPPSRFSSLKAKILKERAATLRAIGSPSDGVLKWDLFVQHSLIVDMVEQFTEASESSVILDISTFPKKFFFPIVKVLLRSSKVRTLLVTYTVPQRYYEGAFSEDPKPLAPLPLFGPETFPERPIDVAFVGVGFVPLGIIEMFQPSGHQAAVRLFFPFPVGPMEFERNWEFIRYLEKSLPETAKDPVRVPPHHVSDVFEHICSETANGRRAAIFAPFGPKPISLAMCLYANLTGSPAYYTQPTVYHPEYSKGVRVVNGVQETYAYCLRLDGRDLFSIDR